MSMRTGVLTPDRPLRAESREISPPLLKTKLFAPRRGRGILPRPRLEALHTRIADSRLTVLESPAGYGKTTLATIWADDLGAKGHAVGWLSLDDDDRDVRQIQRYLFAAIAQAYDPAAVMDAHDEPSESMTALINSLSQASRPLVLFVDDCHRVSADLLVGALGRLLQRAPVTTHLVLCSRSPIPTALKQALYLDDLIQLGTDELKFDLEETRDLLRKTSADPGLDLAELQRCSEGWVAGLRACLHAPGTSGSLHGASLGCIRHVFEEALQGLPAGQRRAIMPLGLLDRFNDAMLRAVLGEHAAHGLIDAMIDQSLFIQPLDESRAWYGLHPMFREYLKSRYLRRNGEDAGRFLLAAAQWCAGHERWLDAIRLGMEGGHMDAVRVWIEGCAMELLEQGDFATLVALEKRWHTHASGAPLALKIARGWALGVALEPEAARAMIAEITLDAAAQGDQAAWVEGEVRALEAMLAGLADQNHVSGPLAERCYQSVNLRPWVRNVLLNLISCSHFHAGRWDAFYTVPPTLCGPGMPAGMLFHDCYRQSLHALALLLQGRLAEGIVDLNDFLQRVSGRFANMPDRPNPSFLGLPQAVIAQSQYLLGNRAAAQACLAQGTDLVDIAGFLDCTAAAYCTSARLAWHQGQHQRARRLLEQLEGLANVHNWDRLRARVLMERTRLNLLDGKLREATACTNGLAELAAAHGNAQTWDYTVYATLAALWLALHRNEADDMLEERACLLATQLEERELRLWHAEICVALGLLQSVMGAGHGHSALLERGLAGVESSGALAIVFDCPLGATVVRCEERVAPGSWERIQLIRSEAGVGTAQDQRQAAAVLDLTVKERQVMQLVAEGKSNKQIARDLNVAPETIKSHMKSIFAKLKVDNRAQAAVMLRQAG
ncbi:hypothetical protein KEM63_08790 [Halopseudomonas nanhaiensis]|uniref:LuxR C-terminal-related transcriptional regulator n=1 Tax=Halopseudomonas nanhaiensis TaxID=2830842 RepID=UPI001CBED2F3|nr:LuxR C-terminal-related transcriptional regulator [Halopseudomonas nanhaiensis]UAW96940.1 hypothetical protein KEM63_08790 [Halopseudomonas nanhaiensis]